MLTRKATTRVCERQGKYSFKSISSFPQSVLPTKRDDLKRLLHERNWRTTSAAVTVANELSVRWIHCNVDCISINVIVSRIQTVIKDFRKIKSQPKKGKMGATTSAIFENNMKKFLSDILEVLFDVFCNKKQLRKLEELHKLRMNETDFGFYGDQKGPRKEICLNVVKNLEQSDLNLIQKTSQKRSTNMASTSSVNDNMLLSSESENSETDNDNKASELSSTSTSDYETPSSSNRITAQQNRVCLKELAIVCERYEVSDRAGAAIASATLKAFKIVTEEDRRYVVDRSKLRRERQKHKEEIREKKSLFTWWIPFI